MTAGQSGQTYCVSVKDEPRNLQTVSLSNMPLSTTNSSVIQYTPSADGQFFIPGMLVYINRCDLVVYFPVVNWKINSIRIVVVSLTEWTACPVSRVLAHLGSHWMSNKSYTGTAYIQNHVVTHTDMGRIFSCIDKFVGVVCILNVKQLDLLLAVWCVFLLIVQRNSSSVMSFSPGWMAAGDGLHGDEAGRKRELRLLKNKLVRSYLPSLVFNV